MGGGGYRYVYQLSEFQIPLFHILRSTAMALSVLINPFLCCFMPFRLVLRCYLTAILLSGI